MALSVSASSALRLLSAFCAATARLSLACPAAPELRPEAANCSLTLCLVSAAWPAAAFARRAVRARDGRLRRVVAAERALVRALEGGEGLLPGSVVNLVYVVGAVRGLIVAQRPAQLRGVDRRLSVWQPLGGDFRVAAGLELREQLPVRVYALRRLRGDKVGIISVRVVRRHLSCLHLQYCKSRLMPAEPGADGGGLALERGELVRKLLHQHGEARHGGVEPDEGRHNRRREAREGDKHAHDAPFRHFPPSAGFS